MCEVVRAVDLPAWWNESLGGLRQRLLQVLADRLKPGQVQSTNAALSFAERCHQGQTRACGEPYIIHPIRACLSAICEGEVTDVPLLRAVLLHDVVENGGAAEQEISRGLESQFGEATARLVRAVSRGSHEKRPGQGDCYDDRYYQRIREAGPQAIVLKIVDKVDNLRDAIRHPDALKRSIFVKEGFRVFGPLVRHLQDASVRSRWSAILDRAMMNHPLCVEQSLLFNPAINHWLTRDSIQIVRTSLDTPRLVQNIIRMLLDRIGRDECRRLADIADIPSFLADTDRRPHWDRLSRQLGLLLSMFSQEQPAWVQPVLHSRLPLLSLVHSRLLMPANWLFPVWQGDYALSLLRQNERHYHLAYGDQGRLWTGYLSIILRNREALLRQQSGQGSLCSQQVLEMIRSMADRSPECGLSEVLSMRLVSEYLDATTGDASEGQDLLKVFSALWRRLGDMDILAEGPRCRRPGSPPRGRSQWEVEGLAVVQHRFPGCSKQLNRISQIVQSHALRSSRRLEGPAWIHFNHTEILKRASFFEAAVRDISGKTTFDVLRDKGISVRSHILDNRAVFTIEPDRWDALKDRLPEISEAERERIRDRDYSAVSIFDTLLLQRIGSEASDPLWIPRVYRILDTMADFDPQAVQRIRIMFHGDEEIDDVVVYLAIPSTRFKREGQLQERRKRAIARYIATTVYNYAMTLGLHSATIDCLPIPGPQQAMAFPDHELELMVSEAAREYNYEQQYGRYIDIYNYQKFSIGEGLQTHLPVTFGKADVCSGSFLGIDIGGTDVKACLFVNGQPVPAENPLICFPTVEKMNQGRRVSAEEFCKRILSRIEEKLREGLKEPPSWRSIEGVGISWPGAVRDSRIVGFSGTLSRLSFSSNGTRIDPDKGSGPDVIHSTDLARVFRSELRRRCSQLTDFFVVSLENDGNAEAYGNYWELRKQGDGPAGGALVLKLGTSLAGGHISPSGAISPHVAEFSKLILDFNTSPGGDNVRGAVRNFVSSQGVRDLTRSFRFEGRIVFGPLTCRDCGSPLNLNDSLDSRVEAVEVGQLLTFFDMLREEDKSEFLQELIVHDNQGAPCSRRLSAKLADELASNREMQRHLRDYINSRGEEIARLRRRQGSGQEGHTSQWQLGVNRTLALLHLPVRSDAASSRAIPASLDRAVLARAVLGSVALFSQLGLHTAHLVAALYNIYKRRRFTEVILAGGVLRSASGRLVERQTQAFLGKYYDKIFGPTKHLKPGCIRLASNSMHPDTVGPFGAAMVANRQHKLQSLAAMEKQVEAVIVAMVPGRHVTVRSLAKSFGSSRLTEEDVRRCIQGAMSRSLLVQDRESRFMRTMNLE